MKILITGGHLSPALSVISELKKEKHKILYVGRKYALEGDKAYSLEYTTIKELGIDFFPITTGRLQRKFTKHTIPSVLKFPIGLSQGFYVLSKFNPDVVLGFGSYVSLPVITAAFILRIPVVIHEQTFGVGMANKIASRFSSKICISWQTSKRFFPSNKTVLTGNPLRKEILEVEKNPKIINNPPLIYITGGSLGSHFINLLIKDSISGLTKNFKVFHQTGDAKKYNDFDQLQKLKGDRYEVRKFLNPKESAEILENADIVVARAGINTVSEIMFLGKPSLLIPLPVSQNNEQLKNALFVRDNHLGEVLEQKNANSKTFIDLIEKLYKNIDSYKKSGNFSNKDSASKIVEVIKNVNKKKKTKK